MSDINKKMTDLEITKIIAEWCGLKYTIYSNKVFLIPSNPEHPEIEFDPINDWQDLMEIVVPKIIDGIAMEIYPFKKCFTFNGENAPDISGNYPTDFRRAVCEFVVENAKGGKE